MSLIRRAVAERRSWTSEPDIPPNSLAGGIASSAGVSVTPVSAMRMSAVYGCVRVLAESVSSTPLYVYEMDGGIRRRVTTGPMADRLESLFVDEDGDPMEQWDGIHRWMTSLALRGNAYGLPATWNGRYPTSLLPLHPDSVRAKPVDGTWRWEVDRQPVEKKQLVRIPLMTFGQMPVGIGPLDSREAIGVGLAAQEFAARFYSQGATTSGVIEVPGTLDDTQLKELATQWSQRHAGLSKAHLPGVLTNGAKYSPISVTPEQAQFLETRKFQRTEIYGLFGVPPHMVSDVEKSTSWGSGIESMSIGFVRFTLRPYLKRIQAALSRVLPPGYNARFDLSDLLEADTASRYASYAIARTGGWLNIDEIRQNEDMPPVPEVGDNHLLPLNSALNGADLAALAGIGTGRDPKPEPETESDA